MYLLYIQAIAFLVMKLMMIHSLFSIYGFSFSFGSGVARAREFEGVSSLPSSFLPSGLIICGSVTGMMIVLSLFTRLLWLWRMTLVNFGSGL